MASITTDSGGKRRVQFVDGTDRRAVRLGKVSMKQAERVRAGVEALQAAQLTGVLDLETTKWLREIDDMLHARLAAVGAVRPTPATRKPSSPKRPAASWSRRTSSNT